MTSEQIIAALVSIQDKHTLTHAQACALAWCQAKLLVPRASKGWIDGEREDRQHGQESK